MSNADTLPARSMGANLLPKTRRNGSVSARLREELRSSVVQKGAPGDRVPSERALARQFGVSPLTISRAMQELQSEGVVERLVGKGTFISQSPASPSVGEIKGDGVVRMGARDWPANIESNGCDARAAQMWIVASLGGSDEPQAREFWSHRLASHLERWTQKGGGRTVITNQETVAAGDVAALAEAMVERGINSVVFLVDGPQETTKTWMHQLLRLKARDVESRVEVTQISFGNGNRWPLDTVRFNGEQGAWLATSHLLELGHREIAFLAPAPTLPWVADRFAGFERALEMADVATSPDNAFFAAPAPMNDALWSHAAREAGARLLRNREFSAVVAANDAIAKTFIQMAREQNLRVPEDISVVGFDDWRYSSTLGLTTVHPPIELMGEVAASLALQRLSQPFEAGHIEVVLDPTLVVRSSTRAI